MCINETQINDQETYKMHTQENNKETSTYKLCIILAKDSANPKQILVIGDDNIDTHNTTDPALDKLISFCNVFG